MLWPCPPLKINYTLARITSKSDAICPTNKRISKHIIYFVANSDLFVLLLPLLLFFPFSFPHPYIKKMCRSVHNMQIITYSLFSFLILILSFLILRCITFHYSFHPYLSSKYASCDSAVPAKPCCVSSETLLICSSILITSNNNTERSSLTEVTKL